MSTQNQGQTPQPELHNPQIEILPHPVVPQPASNGTPLENPPASAQRPPRKVTRNGKIARLPKIHRDMVNRMLRNNLPEKQIASALDEVGITVTPRNVSNWKTRGGFKEWCLEQDHALQVRLLQDNITDYLRNHDASQVPEVALQLVATYLSDSLLKPDAWQQFAADPEKCSRMIASLCRLANQIHTLQKYRDDSARELGRTHDPERIKQEEQECVEGLREIYSSKLGKGPKDPNIPYRNYMPKEL